MTAVRILYNLAFPLVLLVLLPRFIFRMIKRGKYRHKFGQRFAIYSPRVRKKLSRGGWTWVHAVSVGEVMIALKLIRELRSREPDDAKRWEALGVDTRKIVCTGSIKFDDQGEECRVRRNFRQTLAELGVAETAPVLLAGSTHAGEERLIGEIVIRLKKDFPSIF